VDRLHPCGAGGPRQLARTRGKFHSLSGPPSRDRAKDDEVSNQLKPTKIVAGCLAAAALLAATVPMKAADLAGQASVIDGDTTRTQER
jgi:hypothetical protein